MQKHGVALAFYTANMELCEIKAKWGTVFKNTKLVSATLFGGSVVGHNLHFVQSWFSEGVDPWAFFVKICTAIVGLTICCQRVAVI